MRRLCSYICAHINNNERIKEIRAICESYDELQRILSTYNPQKGVLLENFEDDEKKLYARIYANIFRWGLVEPGFGKWKEEKKVDGDETQLLETYLGEMGLHSHAFLKNYMRAHMYAAYIVNGRTFFYVNYDDIAYQSDRIELVFTYYIARDTIMSTPLRYKMRHGPVIYDGKKMTLGVYTLSVHLPDKEPCIYSCHMKCRIGSHYFQYHLCTNTLLHSRNEKIPTDYSCARGRILELWCRKKEIVQKFMARIRSAHISDEEQTVHNFL